MDVGDNPANQQKSQQQTLDEADIEQSILQQFSCLGTTVHDEVVGKFQKLLGNQLNYTIARFFLDMNNLPAAVGCYFDFYSGQKLPSMQIVADVTIGEGSYQILLSNNRGKSKIMVMNVGQMVAILIVLHR